MTIFSSRRCARMLALQALYASVMSGYSVDEIEQQLLGRLVESVESGETDDCSHVDVNYFKVLFHGVLHNTEGLDRSIEPYLDRPLNELTPIELCTLHIAVFELIHCVDVPFRVVINEAIELNKAFGVTAGFKYINGVLDQVAHEVRKNEIAK